MRCSTAKKLISDYIDHSLDSKKVSALEHHLQQCPDCKALLKDFERIIEEAQDLESLAPSSETWLKIKTGHRPKTRSPDSQGSKNFEAKVDGELLHSPPTQVCPGQFIYFVGCNGQSVDCWPEVLVGKAASRSSPLRHR